MRYFPRIKRTDLPAPPPRGPWLSLTLAQAIRRTLSERQGTLRPQTIRNWKAAAAHFQRLLPIPIAKLTHNDLPAFRRKRIAEGCGVNTVSAELLIIRPILVRLELWNELGGGLQFHRQPAQKEGVALSASEKARLLEATRTDPELHDAVRLGLSALRHMEILQLQRRDYDPKSNSLTIRQSKTRAGIRRIPLPGDLAAAMNHRLEKAATGPTAPLFPGGKYHQGSGPRLTFWRAWAAARQEAALGHIRFHDLRHTCITELCEAGVPEQVIRSYVGHVDERMLNLYSHIRTESMSKAAEALSTPAAAPPGRTATQAAPPPQMQLLQIQEAPQADAGSYEQQLLILLGLLPR